MPVVCIEDTGTRTELQRATACRGRERVTLVEYAVTVHVLDTDVVKAERVGSKRRLQCGQRLGITGWICLACSDRVSRLRYERRGARIQVADDRLTSGIVQERIHDRNRERSTERSGRCDLECRFVRRVRGPPVELDIVVEFIGGDRRELVAILRRLVVVERVEIETRTFARYQVPVVAELVAVAAAQVQRRRDSRCRANAR